MKDREDAGQAGAGTNPYYLLLGRGQHKVTTAVPGLPQRSRQRGRAAVGELQVRPIHDDVPSAGPGHSHSTGGAG